MNGMCIFLERARKGEIACLTAKIGFVQKEYTKMDVCFLWESHKKCVWNMAVPMTKREENVKSL